MAFNHRNNANNIAAAANAKNTFVRKKVDLSSARSKLLDNIPASLFPTDVDKKNPPIINAVNRGGDNFETSESPIGDKNNSPKVITP